MTKDKHKYTRQARIASQALRLVSGFLAEHGDDIEPGVVCLIAAGLLSGLERAGLPRDFIIESVQNAMVAVDAHMKDPKP